jgi:hypothetical protein
MTQTKTATSTPQTPRYTVVRNRWGRYDICCDGQVVEGGFFSRHAALDYCEAHYAPATR